MAESGVKKVFLECLIQGMLLAGQGLRDPTSETSETRDLSHMPWSKHLKTWKYMSHGQYSLYG
jgi:hypothetical protein